MIVKLSSFGRVGEGEEEVVSIPIDLRHAARDARTDIALNGQDRRRGVDGEEKMLLQKLSCNLCRKVRQQAKAERTLPVPTTKLGPPYRRPNECPDCPPPSAASPVRSAVTYSRILLPRLFTTAIVHITKQIVLRAASLC